MTSLYPRIQFVDAPNVGATVIADLNEVATVDVEALHEGFTLGVPDLRGEAGRRGRSWGKRRLQVPLHVTGPRDAALAAHRRLARVATRDGWLLYQLDAVTPPVWFRTYATQPTPVEFEEVYVGRRTKDVWAFTLPLDADPFGVGAEVTLGPYTVQNTPTSGGMKVTIPAIGGDLPAPARVEINRTGGLIHGPAVGVAPVAPGVFTATSWDAAVGAAVSNTGFIAGSYRQTTGTLTGGWSPVAVFNPTGLRAGRWRTLLRVSGSATPGAFALRWGILGASGALSDPAVVDVTTQTRWVDLGTIPWPIVDASDLGVAHQSELWLLAQRMEAGGELRFDNQLLMLPVGDDSTLLAAAVSDVNTANTRVLVDATDRQALAVTSAGALPAPRARGGWPLLHPSRDNVMTIFQNLDPTPTPPRDDAHTASASVTVKYRPQYLWGVG